jgi:hypothetical protein
MELVINQAVRSCCGMPANQCACGGQTQSPPPAANADEPGLPLRATEPVANTQRDDPYAGANVDEGLPMPVANYRQWADERRQQQQRTAPAEPAESQPVGNAGEDEPGLAIPRSDYRAWAAERRS